MEQESKRIKSRTQKDELHIYWNDDTWEFPDVREPEIKLHPLGFYNKQFHELKHILKNQELWDDKKIKSKKRKNILNAFSEIQDQASLLSEPYTFKKLFEDFIQAHGHKMFIILHKLLGYHVAQMKGEDQSEFLENHKLVLASFKARFLAFDGKFALSISVYEWHDFTLKNIKLWKEYVWTVAKMPTLTNDHSGLIYLPGAEWYNLLFDPKLIERVMDKKTKFVNTVKGLKYQVNIDNPPNIKIIAPPSFEPKAMDTCCRTDEDTLLFIFMYLLFPEVGKHQDKVNAVKEKISEYNIEEYDINEGVSLSSTVIDNLSRDLNMELYDMKDEIKNILLRRLNNDGDDIGRLKVYDFHLKELKDRLSNYHTNRNLFDLNRQDVLKTIFGDGRETYGEIYAMLYGKETYGGLYNFMKRVGYFEGPSSAIWLSQVLKKKGVPKLASMKFTDDYTDRQKIRRVKEPWRSRKGGGSGGGEFNDMVCR
jgi:hypothetical protein